MLGAIVGDIVGSPFEGRRKTGKRKDFPLFTQGSHPTDDSYMTLAVARAILDCRGDYARLAARAAARMREIGARYPFAGYGAMFSRWLSDPTMGPYNSFGNGSAMRVSPCGFAGRDLDEVRRLSREVSRVSHSHPEGLKGAEAVACCVWLAGHGAQAREIRAFVQENYYDVSFSVEAIRPAYRADVTCQGSVPQAIACFLESTDFEDAVRSAVALDGDTDTQGAMAGAIAEARYGVPEEIRLTAKRYLDDDMLAIVDEFEGTFPPRAVA